VRCPLTAILPESAYGAQEKAPPSLGRATGATAHASPWLSSFESDVVTPIAATRLSFCAGNPVKIPYPYFS
jgi:hypothetical protein